MGSLPNFLLIGAMRSGTTSLARYLGAHPDIFVAPQKEIHFFDFNFERGDDWYRQQFAGVSTERHVGEATQTYMYDSDIPPKMAALLPDARLIAILRNPVDRAYSHYWHSRTHGKEPLQFSEAISVEVERLASAPDRRIRYAYSYVDRGHYLSQLKRVCEYYPREALLVILFENLRDAPRETFTTLCSFLGADGCVIPDNIGGTMNSAVRFRSLKLRQWLKRFPASLVPARVLGRVNTREFSYPPLDPSVRASLLNVFEKETAALESWLGLDLSVWGI